MAQNPYVNKVVFGSVSIIDISDTTAVASDVAQGKYFYAATGEKLEGTATGGGGAAITVTDTTDTHGGIIREITAVDISNDTVTAAHLESGYTAHDAQGNAITGTLSPGGGGLEYEEGTWTPSADSNYLTSPFSFTNVHTVRPIYILIADVNGTEASVNSVLYWAFVDWYDTFGSYIYSSATVNHYARRQYGYKGSSQATHGGGVFTSEQDISDYVTSSGFIPQMATSYYWRAGRTYKWIAVWKPTT